MFVAFMPLNIPLSNVKEYSSIAISKIKLSSFCTGLQKEQASSCQKVLYKHYIPILTYTLSLTFT